MLVSGSAPFWRPTECFVLATECGRLRRPCGRRPDYYGTKKTPRTWGSGRTVRGSGRPPSVENLEPSMRWTAKASMPQGRRTPAATLTTPRSARPAQGRALKRSRPALAWLASSLDDDVLVEPKADQRHPVLPVPHGDRPQPPMEHRRQPMSQHRPEPPLPAERCSPAPRLARCRSGPSASVFAEQGQD